MAIGLTPYQVNVCYYAATLCGILSLLCSLSTILIICNMKKISGYVWLVFNLAISTLFIDISQIMTGGNLESNDVLCQSSGFFKLYGNMAAGLWILSITVSVASIAIRVMKLNIAKNIITIGLICNLIPISIGLAAILTHNIEYTNLGNCFLPKTTTAVEIVYDIVHYFYFWASITLYCIIWYSIFKMRRDVASGLISINDIANNNDNAIDFRSSIFELIHNIRRSFTSGLAASSSSSSNQLRIEAIGKRKLNAVEILVARLIWYPTILIVVELFRDLDRYGKSSSFPLHLLHLLSSSLQGTHHHYYHHYHYHHSSLSLSSLSRYCIFYCIFSDATKSCYYFYKYI